MWVIKVTKNFLLFERETSESSMFGNDEVSLT